MTLVIGRALSDIGFLVADTMLSVAFELKDHKGPVNGKFHALKIQIIDSNTAIAFSGDVEGSFELIAKLSDELKADPNMGVPERLFESYKQIFGEKPPDCEFLVLQVTSTERKLARVATTGISYQSRAYIGDAAEYERMTQLITLYDPPKTQQVQQHDGTFRTEPLNVSAGEVEFEEIARALEELTHQRNSETVGAISGSIIRVVDAKNSRQLVYLQSVEATVSPWEGQAGYSFLASNSDARGVGLYYRAGKLGYLFVVGDSEPCRKENAETLQQFIDIAKEKHGLNLEGGTWND
jgi:hypothetical protein